VKRKRKREGKPGWVAQSVERTVDNGKVVGSTPISPKSKGEKVQLEKRSEQKPDQRKEKRGRKQGRRDDRGESPKKEGLGSLWNEDGGKGNSSRRGRTEDEKKGLPRPYGVAIQSFDRPYGRGLPGAKRAIRGCIQQAERAVRDTALGESAGGWTSSGANEDGKIQVGKLDGTRKMGQVRDRGGRASRFATNSNGLRVWRASDAKRLPIDGVYGSAIWRNLEAGCERAGRGLAGVPSLRIWKSMDGLTLSPWKSEEIPKEEARTAKQGTWSFRRKWWVAGSGGGNRKDAAKRKRLKKRKSETKHSISKFRFQTHARGGYRAEKVNVVRSIRVLVKTSIEIRRRKKVKKENERKKDRLKIRSEKKEVSFLRKMGKG
jgi:hypothetical protein